MVARDVEVSLMLKKPREVDVVAAETVGERYIEAPPRPTAGQMYNLAASLVCSVGVCLKVHIPGWVTQTLWPFETEPPHIDAESPLYSKSATCGSWWSGVSRETGVRFPVAEPEAAGVAEGVAK